jgi:RNA processing factor Prp31|tara:strand:- start:24 stop:272 length:249 start_codon:yes stop_codon:yes gene_type:complete
MVAKIQATKMDLDFKDGEVDGTDWKKKFEDEMEKQRNKDKDPAKKKKPEKGMFAKSKNMSAGAKAGGAKNEFSTSSWNSKGK